MELVIATQNLHKLRELKAMLALPHLELLSLRDFPHYTPPPEEGKTFRENAEAKALHAAKRLGKWVLADDSGLVVPALAGSPGVFSARYAGPNARDGDNRKKLLEAMEELSGLQRAASFQCVLALANPQGIEKVVEGLCEGTILDHEEGSHGFGYDSLFLENDYNQTYAQLSEEVKNRISHRRKALDKLHPYLERHFAQASR